MLSRCLNRLSRAHIASAWGSVRPMSSSAAHSSYGSTDPNFDEAKKATLDSNAPLSNRTINYMTLGASRFVLASMGRVAVMKFIASMSASADVLALASIEINLDTIPEGTTTLVKWRGKPVFIRHRTASDISRAQADDNASLRDPEKDSERTQRPEWLIVVGVCTHLGCVPISDAGDYKAWFCPCHGSHYDISGRIRKGPAPLNLEVPTYTFMGDDKVVIG